MLFTPLLASGKAVKLPWPLAYYRRCNIIAWPLEDNAAWWAYIITKSTYVLGFLIFLMHNEAELRYFYKNRNKLDDFLTGIPTYFVLVEIHLRAFTSSLNKKTFKQMLKKFYAEIYIEESSRPDIHARNIRNYYPVLAFSMLYLGVYMFYIAFPVYGIAMGGKPLLYKMILPFDYQPWVLYIPLVLSNVWLGTIVISTIAGESYTLTMFIHNLDGRYQIMSENLILSVEKILKSTTNDPNAIEKFNQVIVDTLKENIRLNQFAQEVQNEFSFRIFTIFSFLAATLCVLVFKVYTSPANNVQYILWTMGKVQETIAFGQIGTSITTRTNAISSMYYESKWESIIQHSTDTKANVRLMKFITLTIAINKKPFNLTGMNFFDVSLASALTILQGAASYFTFLISLR
ncbi:odorant receptor 35a-like [Musca autumnalis]|uniref:odorant receptor 35a-like n=1 Tax=Musca autumnalis TaxID=221902 RepID=UPI003CF8050A